MGHACCITEDGFSDDAYFDAKTTALQLHARAVMMWQHLCAQNQPESLQRKHEAYKYRKCRQSGGGSGVRGYANTRDILIYVYGHIGVGGRMFVVGA